MLGVLEKRIKVDCGCSRIKSRHSYRSVSYFEYRIKMGIPTMFYFMSIQSKVIVSFPQIPQIFASVKYDYDRHNRKSIYTNGAEKQSAWLPTGNKRVSEAGGGSNLYRSRTAIRRRVIG